MTDRHDILDLIDAAVADHTVSTEAMRCRPNTTIAAFPAVDSIAAMRMNWPARAEAIRAASPSCQEMGERLAAGFAAMPWFNATWTAPQSGRYHVVSGMQPHLFRDCVDECRTRQADGDPHTQSVTLVADLTEP